MAVVSGPASEGPFTDRLEEEGAGFVEEGACSLVILLTGKQNAAPRSRVDGIDQGRQEATGQTSHLGVSWLLEAADEAEALVAAFTPDVVVRLAVADDRGPRRDPRHIRARKCSPGALEGDR